MTAAKRRASSGTSQSAAVEQQQYQLNHHHQHHHQQPQQQQSQQQQQYQHQQQLQQQTHAQQHQHVQTYQYTGQNNSQQNYSHQNHHHHQYQQQNRQQHHNQQHYQKLRDCSVKLPLDILWLPKSAMRPAGPEASHTDCILVVGVSRPKLAVVFLTVMLISLFLTFHVLYDSAVYNIQAAQQSVTTHQRLALLSAAAAASNRLPEFIKPVGGTKTGSSSVVTSSNQISHPMVFPSNRVHFPKTSRRLPQALIIGIRKCGTRALLEMLYLHPRIQKAGGEVHFFDRDENYMRGLEWYRKKMPHSFRGQITIEKSPSYFVSPEVPERVRAMNASIKLLLIVREPVTRAISDYTQLRSHAATATLPLAGADNVPAELGVAALKTATAARMALAETSLPQQKSHSLLYGKLSAYSAAAAAAAMATHVYDGGGTGGKRNGMAAVAVRNGNINRQYDGAGSGSGGNEYFSNPPTAAAPSSLSINSAAAAAAAAAAAVAAAQIASRSFEELAMFPNGTVNESYRPLTISMYHLHLHRWLEVFPREQLLVVNGDRLIDDPVSQLRRIETFLGIEHRVTSKHFYFNETKGFYCLRYDSGDRCLRETKGRRHPHVDPVVISKLRKYFAEHNQRFYELVGEDLGWPEE